MKKFILFICFIFLCFPVFAYDEKGAQESLNYLNQLVLLKIESFTDVLYADQDKIKDIIIMYKANPRSIKTNDIYKFGVACEQRSKQLLKIYKQDYFKPAYLKYKEFDPKMSFDDWIDSVGISEASKFYDFYGLTEANLRDCKLITERATSH